MADVHSNILNITKDAPQGSVLGPVLFSVYINANVPSPESGKLHLYADDTAFYRTAASTQSAIQRLQASLIHSNYSTAS